MLKSELLFGQFPEESLRRELNRARGQKENYVAHDDPTECILMLVIARRCSNETHLYEQPNVLTGRAISIYRIRQSTRFRRVSTQLKVDRKRKIG